MEVKQALVWSGLLLSGQTTDTITTAMDRARGAFELMPVSRSLLDAGGLAAFWGFKVLLVAAATAVLLLAARAVKPNDRLSVFTYRVALVSVQVATMVLVWVSLSNTVLLGTLLS